MIDTILLVTGVTVVMLIVAAIDYAVCILSSRISREEERREGDL